MTNMEMAKEAFASRRAVDAWFKDAAPNFDAFAELVRKDEREKCAELCEAEGAYSEQQEMAQSCAERILGR